MIAGKKAQETKTKFSHGLQTWTQKISFWETIFGLTYKSVCRC